eukprot:Pgem_evm1s3315
MSKLMITIGAIVIAASTARPPQPIMQYRPMVFESHADYCPKAIPTSNENIYDLEMTSCNEMNLAKFGAIKAKYRPYSAIQASPNMTEARCFALRAESLKEGAKIQLTKQSEELDSNHIFVDCADDYNCLEIYNNTYQPLSTPMCVTLNSDMNLVLDKCVSKSANQTFVEGLQARI